MTDETRFEIVDHLATMQKAYAFLHDFHAHLGDTVSELVEEIANDLDIKFTFYKSLTTHTQHTSFRQNPFNRQSRWVWDWLPLYNIQALYEATPSDRHGTMALDVCFEADKRWGGRNDQSPLIEGADAAHTNLDLYIWYHGEPAQDWKASWDQSEYPKESGAFEAVENGFKAMKVTIDLHCLTDKVAIARAAETISNDIKAAINAAAGVVD